MFRCQSCRFYCVEQNREGAGLCRRRPPVVPTRMGDRFSNDSAIFPVVFDDDWCGEFEPRTASLSNAKEAVTASSSM